MGFASEMQNWFLPQGQWEDQDKMYLQVQDKSHLFALLLSAIYNVHKRRKLTDDERRRKPTRISLSGHVLVFCNFSWRHDSNAHLFVSLASFLASGPESDSKETRGRCKWKQSLRGPHGRPRPQSTSALGSLRVGSTHTQHQRSIHHGPSGAWVWGANYLSSWGPRSMG